MKNLVWTKELPIEEGLYFYRNKKGCKITGAFISMSFIHDNNKGRRLAGLTVNFIAEEDCWGIDQYRNKGAEWAGPIPLPKEN